MFLALVSFFQPTLNSNRVSQITWVSTSKSLSAVVDFGLELKTFPWAPILPSRSDRSGDEDLAFKFSRWNNSKLPLCERTLRPCLSIARDFSDEQDSIFGFGFWEKSLLLFRRFFARLRPTWVEKVLRGYGGMIFANEVSEAANSLSDSSEKHLREETRAEVAKISWSFRSSCSHASADFLNFFWIFYKVNKILVVVQSHYDLSCLGDGLLRGWMGEQILDG